VRDELKIENAKLKERAEEGTVRQAQGELVESAYGKKSKPQWRRTEGQR